ncbi:IncP plasmid survival protein KfrC family protein [Hahella ganghwensis]|uniref:IncP plasmid survival protein KfrC family protein n=1 Tax=Hahella ganghwensis TaxID=286420 RepID=UPI0003695443|nr:IncP plasmid survival protein KfrC family protein [Hahella ganghwensis]
MTRIDTSKRPLDRLRATSKGPHSEGLNLLTTAEGLEAEQESLLSASSLEATYRETLAVYVQSKNDQVDKIESRIMALINRQQSALQHLQARPPGVLSLPASRRAWQSRQVQQRSRIQVLHNRLDHVREIKEGMGLYSPKIEELATRKMRSQNPELASDWDFMRESLRRHQALLKRQNQEQKKSTQQPGHTHAQKLSSPDL